MPVAQMANEKKGAWGCQNNIHRQSQSDMKKRKWTILLNIFPKCFRCYKFECLAVCNTHAKTHIWLQLETAVHLESGKNKMQFLDVGDLFIVLSMYCYPLQGGTLNILTCTRTCTRISCECGKKKATGSQFTASNTPEKRPPAPVVFQSENFGLIYWFAFCITIKLWLILVFCSISWHISACMVVPPSPERQCAQGCCKQAPTF